MCKSFLINFFRISQISIFFYVSIVVIDLCILIWFSIEESSRKLSVCAVWNLFLIPWHVRFIFLRRFQIVIDRLTVCSRDCRYIKCSFHTSLDLQAVDPTVQDIIHMLNHTEILGVKNISAPLIFINRHVFARTLFLNYRIFPTAWMCTCALIGISSYKIIAQQASSWIGNAHCSMYKCLNFHIIRNICTDLTNLFQRQFTCSYNTFGSETVPESISLIIGIICLCTDVAFDLRADFTGISKDSRVCNDQCIWF